MAEETKTALTGAQRQARSVKRKKAAGMIQAKVWVHPDEAAKVRAYAAKQPKTKAALKNA